MITDDDPPYPRGIVDPWEQYYQDHRLRRTRTRKPTIVSVAREMRRAGLDVAKIEIDPATGVIGAVVGKLEIFDSKKDGVKDFDDPAAVNDRIDNAIAMIGTRAKRHGH